MDPALLLSAPAPVVVALADVSSAGASSAPSSPPPPPPKPLDVVEPPFAGDYSWMNGTNSQPSSLLGMGPLTWSLYVDTYFAWQFHRPSDHTIFATTTAPRHDEVSLNLAHVGVDVTGLDGPIGRVYLQYGSTVDAVAGQDTTGTRGFFLGSRVFEYVQQAAAGWHFHWLHGANAEIGIFPSYIGLESYLPEENWSYSHAFIADATPYYFAGARGQLYPSARTKIEVWLVNGWQTFGQWHEARAGGYSLNWRPSDGLSVITSGYAGDDAQGDPHALRVFSDNSVQLRYFKASGRSLLRSLAFSLVGDIGYERRGNAPSGVMGGAALAHRWEWTEQWKSTVRWDFLYDETQAISPKFPAGAAYAWPGTNPFFAAAMAATLDFWPSPWLVTRLEYAHRRANQPLFSGPGGITGPGGQLPGAAGAAGAFTPDLRRSDDRILFNVTLRL